MIGISHISRCYGNSVPMVPKVYSFILSLTESMFGMEVPWGNIYSKQSETSITPYRILIEFIFGNKAKSFLANMNSIQVNTQDLLRLHSGCHGDYIDVATK